MRKRGGIEVCLEARSERAVVEDWSSGALEERCRCSDAQVRRYAVLEAVCAATWRGERTGVAT